MRLSDGGVTCLWLRGGKSVVTRHHEGKSSAWAVIEATFHTPRLCAGRKGELFITEAGPRLARILPNEAKAEIFTIGDELLAKPEKVDEGSRSYAPARAIQAPDGSVWLWSYALQRQQHLWRIPVFVRFDGQKFGAVKGLPFQGDSTISAVIAKNGDSLLVAEAGQTIWQIGIGRDNVVKFEVPDLLFGFVEHMQMVDDWVYVITCPKPDKVDVEVSSTVRNHVQLRTEHYYDTSRSTGNLLRLKGNEIEPLFGGLDDVPAFGSMPRVIVGADSGLMTGSVAGGPTWIDPTSKKARRLGAGSGFGLKDAVDLIALPDRRWLARSSSLAWEVVSTEEAGPTTSSRVTAVKTHKQVVQDSAHNVWAWLATERGLSKWSGGKWTEVSGPDLVPSEFLEMAIDGQQQLWMIGPSAGKSAVLDTRSGKCSNYQSLESAVQAKLGAGDAIHLPHYLVFGPVSHKNGNRAFLDLNGVMHLMQKSEWKRFPLAEIAGKDAKASGKPFFDSAGRFCVPIEGRHHRFNPSGNWEIVDGVNTENDRTYERKEELPLRNVGAATLVSSSMDRHGVIWSTESDGSLWKSLDGINVKLTGIGAVSPLPRDTRIQEVLIDAESNAMLRGQDAGANRLYYIVSALPLPVLGKARFATNTEGEPEISFSKSKGGWNRYRTHGGKWSKPTQEPRVVLHELPVGEHTLEIQCFDSELTALGEIQVERVQRKGLQGSALSKAIQQLGSDALDDRERAAALLRLQGKAALPALEAELRNSEPGSTQQWWVSAVIQSIQRTR
jgi:hypothetical protein